MPVLQHLSAPASDMFDFTGHDFSGYQRAILNLDGIRVGTDGAFLLMRLYTAGVLRTAAYRWRLPGFSTSGSTDDGADASDPFFRIVGGSTSNWGIGNAAGECYSGKIEICCVNLPVFKPVFWGGQGIGPTGQSVRHVGGGHLEETGNITGARIYLSTGTLVSGLATLSALPTS